MYNRFSTLFFVGVLLMPDPKKKTPILCKLCACTRMHICTCIKNVCTNRFFSFVLKSNEAFWILLQRPVRMSHEASSKIQIFELNWSLVNFKFLNSHEASWKFKSLELNWSLVKVPILDLFQEKWGLLTPQNSDSEPRKSPNFRSFSREMRTFWHSKIQILESTEASYKFKFQISETKETLGIRSSLYINVHLHTYIHTHIHTYTHTYIHTHIHTCSITHFAEKIQIIVHRIVSRITWILLLKFPTVV
jgi:hypothetical protein